jgi:hypothetical protein
MIKAICDKGGKEEHTRHTPKFIKDASDLYWQIYLGESGYGKDYFKDFYIVEDPSVLLCGKCFKEWDTEQNSIRRSMEEEINEVKAKYAKKIGATSFKVNEHMTQVLPRD